jgi:hypothetical protein
MTEKIRPETIRKPPEEQRANILRALAQMYKELEELEAEKSNQGPRSRYKHDLLSIKIQKLKNKIRNAENLFDRREQNGW